MQICRIFWKFNLQIVKFFTFKQLELFSKFLILRGKKLNIKLALYILSLVNLVASNDSSTLKPSSNQVVQSRQISTMSPISMRFDRTNLAQKKVSRSIAWQFGLVQHKNRYYIKVHSGWLFSSRQFPYATQQHVPANRLSSRGTFGIEHVLSTCSKLCNRCGLNFVCKKRILFKVSIKRLETGNVTRAGLAIKKGDTGFVLDISAPFFASHHQLLPRTGVRC